LHPEQERGVNKVDKGFNFIYSGIYVKSLKMVNIMSKKKKTNKKANALSISGIEEVVKSEFIHLAIINNITQAQFLATLLNNYKNFYAPLNKEEQEIMQQALKLAPKSLEKKIKRGALRYATDIINLQKVDKSTIDISIRNSPKSADLRADHLIEEIFKHNDTTTNWYDKIFINKNSILDYSEKQKELKPNTISIGKAVLDRCLERLFLVIKDHHKKHSLDIHHNTKAYYERLKLKNLKNQEAKQR